ncbi:MAG TPA: diaminopimelate epimerase [Candidatus Competibacter sp.]|nr:diaminopimelate epimerase [Candidatus Competibacter sp.]
MTGIPFHKYTHCGNSFIIVDELSQFHLPEIEKPLFAKQASDVNFGIGADGLLFIQPFSSETLGRINDTFGYWDKLPLLRSCDYIFRLFEPNMKEALACGNGLLCIMSYLHEHYGIEKTSIMTEIPLSEPNNIVIKINRKTNLYCCNLGPPRCLPKQIVSTSGVEHYKEQVDLVCNLKIKFRSHDLHSFTEDTPLILSGYMTFTGEPHLVFFPDECMPLELSGALFISSGGSNQIEKRINFGSWLVNHIGSYINRHYQNHFPAGINVNFARIQKSTNTIQYRTYERGVDRETLACGTGAAAVAHIARVLKMINDSDVVIMSPCLCVRHEPEAKLLVAERENSILLNGYPSFLLSGQFNYKNTKEWVA